MAWFYLSFAAVLFFAILNLIQRKTSVGSKDPRVLAIIFNTTAASMALVYFLVWGNPGEIKLPSDKMAWVYLGAVTLAFGLYERFRFYVAKLLDASVFTIVGNVAVLVAFLGALILYSEPLSFWKMVGAFLILLALFLVGYVSRSKTKASYKGVIWGVAISAILGLGWMLDKKGAGYFGPSLYNALVWSLPLLAIVFPYVSPKILLAEFKKSWKAISLMAFLNMSGYLMQLNAVSLSEATKVIPVVQTASLVTVVLGIILLKERDNLGVKIVAGIMAFIGVYLLVAVV